MTDPSISHSPRPRDSLRALAQRALNRPLQGDLQDCFYSSYEEVKAPGWQTENVMELRQQLQSNLDYIKEKYHLLPNIARRLDNVARQHVSDFYTGLTLPPLPKKITVESALALMIYFHRSEAARLGVLKECYARVDKIMQQPVPGFRADSDSLLTQALDGETAMAGELQRFLTALQRLARPPAKGEEAEYAAAGETVNNDLPGISGVAFKRLRQLTGQYSAAIEREFSRQLEALAPEDKTSIKETVAPYTIETYDDNGHHHDAIDFSKALPALKGNPHIDLKPFKEIFAHAKWQELQQQFLGRPLSQALQPVFRELSSKRAR